MRRIGEDSAMEATRSGVLARTMSVSTVPGARALMRMFSGASAPAAARVNASRPPFPTA